MIAVAMVMALSVGVMGKESSFRREVAEAPVVVSRYAVQAMAKLRGAEAVGLVRESRQMGDDLAPLVRAFFSLEGVKKWFDARVRWGYPFAHLAGELSLDQAIRIATMGGRVEAELARQIGRHPTLARIEVYRNEDLYFVRAFELAPGLEAHADIDAFRVRTRMRDRVLGRLRHGERLEPSADRSLVGYFESSMLRRVCVPLIDEGAYVADSCSSYYK